MPAAEKRLIDLIEAGWERRNQGNEIRGDSKLTAAVNEAMDLLDSGDVRVADKSSGAWVVNQWLKKAALLSFHLNDSKVMPGSHTNFFDKVALKYAGFDKDQFEESGVRVVPDALVRKGAYVAAKVDGKLIGAPHRAPSQLCNPWEGFNYRRDKNYTYYIPVKKEYKGKNIEVFVLGYDKSNLEFNSELWITAYPQPWEKIKLVLKKK